MTIQSTDFGRAELFGKEAERFQRHMTEDKPNLAAKAPLALGEWPIPSRACTRYRRSLGNAAMRSSSFLAMM